MTPTRHCAKMRHPTLLHALKQRSKLVARGVRPLRAYRCNRCRGYHLTRQPMRWGGKQWPVGHA